MDSRFWHNCWASREIGFHQSQFNEDLVKFWPSLGVQPEGTVLVPLCGKSLDMVWLAEQGHRVAGIELSQVAAAEFFDELGVKPTVHSSDRFDIYSAGNISILCGDFFAATAEDVGEIAGVYDRGATVALPPDMRSRYVERLGELMPDPVPTLLLSFEYDTSQYEGPPFRVNQAELGELYGNRYRIELLEQHPFELPGIKATELIFRLS